MKKPTVSKLKNKAEKLWKAICIKRDGKMCQVKRYYPDVKLKHSDIIQVDHCFSRTDKNLFYDPANGTPVCSACNMPHNKKARILIHKIVKQREGFEKYAQMEQTFIRLGANVNFSKVWWLEAKIKELKNWDKVKKSQYCSCEESKAAPTVDNGYIWCSKCFKPIKAEDI